MTSLTILIVEKRGVRHSTIKLFDIDEVYKKCGFKQSNGFDLVQHQTVVLDAQSYTLELYGKTEGRKDSINQTIIPIAQQLFSALSLSSSLSHMPVYYGTVAILLKSHDTNEYISITPECWNQLSTGVKQENTDNNTDNKDDHGDKKENKEKKSKKQKMQKEVDCSAELEEEEYTYSFQQVE